MTNDNPWFKMIESHTRRLVRGWMVTVLRMTDSNGRNGLWCWMTFIPPARIVIRKMQRADSSRMINVGILGCENSRSFHKRRWSWTTSGRSIESACSSMSIEQPIKSTCTNRVMVHDGGYLENGILNHPYGNSDQWFTMVNDEPNHGWHSCADLLFAKCPSFIQWLTQSSSRWLVQDG